MIYPHATACCAAAQGTRRRTSRLTGSVAALLVIFAGPLLRDASRADDWVGTVSNDWFTAGNWNPAAVPASADSVTINLTGANYSQISAAGAQANQISVGSAAGLTGELRVTGAGTLTIGGFSGLTVGDAGTGIATISGGGQVTAASTTVGNQANSMGTVTVTGTNSLLSTSYLTMGVSANSTGAMTVEAGGQLNVTGGYIFLAEIDPTSSGTLTVTGAGSNLTTGSPSAAFFIGYFGQGTFNLLNGATANTPEIIGIGEGGGSVGIVKVDGNGTTWTTGNVLMGNGGTAQMTISGGAAVTTVLSTSGPVVNISDGASVTVTGAGTSWSIGGAYTDTALVIGDSIAAGSLSIENGATVTIQPTATDPTTADVRLSNGTLTIDGAGSTFTTPYNLYTTFPEAGTEASITVSNGGALNSGAAIIGLLSSSANNVVTVTGTGSLWTVSDTLGNGAGAGTLQIGAASNGTLTIAEGGTVQLKDSASYVTLGGAAGVSATLNIGAPSGSPAVAPGTLDASEVVFATVAAPLTINFNHTSTDYTFAPLITGNGPGVVNVLAGTTILTANNTYVGQTNVLGGQLFVNGSLGNTSVVVGSGGTLGGSGSIGMFYSQTITLQSGGLISPGAMGKGSIGTLSGPSLTWNPGGAILFDLGTNGTSDELALAGAFNGNGAGAYTVDFNFDPNNTTLAGTTFTLVTFSTTNFTAADFPSSVTYQEGSDELIGGFTLQSNDLLFHVAAVQAVGAQYWDGLATSAGDSVTGGSGVWNNTATNWTNAVGSVNSAWGGNIAIFTRTAGTVTLGDNISFTALTFLTSGYVINGDGGGLYSLAPGSGATIDTEADATINAPLTGGGSITKTGPGTLTLGGANGYLGGTTISAGVLAISSDDNLGAASGGLTFENGATLRTLAAITSNRTVTLNTGGGTIDTNGFDSTFGGTFGGSAGLTKIGAGTLTLSGSNAYFGGTAINGGTLAISNDGNLGDASGGLSFANGATLKTLATVTSNRVVALNTGGGTIDTNGFDSTFSGDFSGGGSLTKLGTGTLTLTGASNYSGGTAIGAGTLQIGNGGTSGSITGDVSNNSALTFNRSDDSAYAGSITGSGSVTKAGAGALTLSGASAYEGYTTVDGGSLIVDGSVECQNFVVNTGGALGGSGALGGNLSNGGVVSPGDAPGTLTLTGNYTQTSAGSLHIRIGGPDASQHDLLSVHGSATLAGTVQFTQLNGFQFTLGEKIAFLTATTGVSGAFQTVVNPFASNSMIGAKIAYGMNDVSLEGVQNSFASLVSAATAESAGKTAPETPTLPARITGETFNQWAVAVSLDSALTDPRQANLIEHLDHEPLEKVLEDIDRIAPAALTSIYQIEISQAKLQDMNLQQRLADVRAGSNGFSASGFTMNGAPAAYSGPLGISGAEGPEGAPDKDSKAVFTPSPDNRWGAFATGSGDWTSIGDTENARGYDMTSAGFTLGVDYKATDHFVFGLAAGYSRDFANLTDSGRITADTATFSLYGSYFTGGFYADGALQGGYSTYGTSRAALEGDARGDAGGGDFNALFGTGYLWKTGNLQFGPTANFEYTYAGLSDFTERSSLAPLEYPSQRQQSERTTLGATATYQWRFGSALVIPEISAGWQHEYGDGATPALDARFADGAGPGFTILGPATGRDSLVVEAGFAIQWSPRFSTYLYYDGEMARMNYQSHAISGGIRVEF